MLPRLSFFLLFCLLALPAKAAMTIEIVGGAANRIPIAILPFSIPVAPGMPPGLQNPTEVVSGDLGRSGYFRMLDVGDVTTPPAEPQALQLPAWKSRGADAVVIGQIRPLSNDRIEVRFWLFDAVRQTQLAALAYTTTPEGLRAVAHRIADAVHQALLGEPGAYGGRIAYILKRGGRYELQVADADSQNAVTVTASPEPLISPAWSPDGRRLAYVSFEDKKPVVYVQNLADGRRHAVAKFRGSNSAPAWSPDGRRLAVTLSKDETSQIYLLDLLTGEASRFTRGGALDTEAVFSPDGQWLYFTSDRGGSPQIYRASLATGEATRVTFEGGYNVSPALSPNGRTLAFVHRRDGRFHVAVMDLNSRQMQVLTETVYDESPSFAANGRLLLYATLVNDRGVLATVSVDGKVKQRLSQSGDLREPAWGP
ncbi:MAG: Tol-Pal system beta propeller repeat protein TolB [Gallionellaceae bacterium]|nr:Tol-Pal system beta propeller repeat protein TolB [Gallionellaceae bacterium]